MWKSSTRNFISRPWKRTLLLLWKSIWHGAEVTFLSLIHIYVVNIPPKKEGICDVCGAELVQRADDNEETAANRIDVYNKETKPLIDYYEKAGNIAHVDGTICLENFFNKIVEIVGE